LWHWGRWLIFELLKEAREQYELGLTGMALRRRMFPHRVHLTADQLEAEPMKAQPQWSRQGKRRMAGQW